MHTLLILIAVLLPVVTGASAWKVLSSRFPISGMSVWWSGAVVSVGAAIAVHAMGFEVLMILGTATISSVMVIDLILCLGCLALAGLSIRAPDRRVIHGVLPEPIPAWGTFRLDLWAGAALLLAIIGSVSYAWLQFQLSPLGDWDAWIIWNTKARFLYLSPDTWRETIASLDWWHHPDYPLTHSASVARVWIWAGESPLAPFLISLLYPLLTVMLMVIGVSYHSGRLLGLSAALLLLVGTAYRETFWAQCADGPLAFFLLACLVSLSLAWKFRSLGWWMLAGLTAGCAASMKNEGLAWLVLVSLAILLGIILRATRKDLDVAWKGWTVGLMIPLSLVIFVKLQIGVSNDLFSGGESGLSKLMSISRHLQVTKFLGACWFGQLPEAAREPDAIPLNDFQIFRSFPGILLLLLISFSCRAWMRKKKLLPVFVISLVLGMLLIDHLVFVMTPHELDWHLFSAGHRVVAQLWPAAVFAVMQAFPLRDDEELLEESSGETV